MISSCRLEPAVADVVGDAAGEQERLLEHDAHLLAQRLECQRADVRAVQEDAPLFQIVRNGGIRLTSVVLPAPVGPTRAITCPGRASKEISFSVSARVW